MKKLYFLALSIFASASLMATQVQVEAGDNLQAAVNVANSGDTVLVQAGTYEGNFTMKDGVYVSGGWNEDFTAQTKHASILDAKANGRVLNQPANFETLTIWDNFTIQNGKLTAFVDEWGPGVALHKNGRIINCLVQNNTFTYTGKNCAGGGVCYNIDDKEVISNNPDTCAINCLIKNNKASHGGGVRLRNAIIIDCIVENNTATANGGGVYLWATAEVHNSIISRNTALLVGGLDLGSKGCAIYNCLVTENTATDIVGGVQVRNGGSVVNCSIIKNNHENSVQNRTEAESWCGARFSNGTASTYAGKLCVNNVIWGNTVKGEVQVIQANSHIQHYEICKNNALSDTTKLSKAYFALNADNNAANGPQFIDSTYAFAWTSPLYNAGSNEALTYLVGDKDVYGNARKQGENIDLGAVEHTVHTLTVAAVENGTLALKVLEQTMPLEAKAYEVPAGFTATILATPAEKYALQSILLNGSVLAAVEDVYTLPAVQSDVTLGATFVTESDPDNPTNVENVLSTSQVVAVYDLLGHQVNATPANLTSGLYIVVTTQGTHKISIK